MLLLALGIGGSMGAMLALHRLGPPDPAPQECRITLKGKPVFLSGGSNGEVIAILDQDPEKRRFLWPQSALAAGDVPPATLCFTFFQSPSRAPLPLELARIESDSTTLYDASVCQIHREAMHRTRILPQPATAECSPSPSIEHQLFPHSGLVLSAPESSGSELPVWVCESCRRERDRWLDKARRSAAAAN